jgi:hypothetical protein
VPFSPQSEPRYFVIFQNTVWRVISPQSSLCCASPTALPGSRRW